MPSLISSPPPPPPVLSSLLQLIENNNINDNNVIRNGLKELLVKVCNSRFALLNVYTVSHFYCLHENLFMIIIIHFLLFVNRYKEKKFILICF